MKLSDFQHTPIEREGVWFACVDVHTGAPIEGCRVRVAALDTEDYQLDLNRRLTQPMARKGRRRGRYDELPTPEEQREAVVQAMADHVLLDWEGIEDDDGSAIPCTRENRVLFLRAQRFREMIEDFGRDSAAYREAERGNSRPSPATG